MMIASHGTAHHVEKLVSKFRTAKRLQDDEVANRQHSDREVTHFYDHDGCLVIKARLPAEQGALIVKALEMAMDEGFRENDVCPEGTSTAVTSGQETPERQPIAARRAGALAEIDEAYMNNKESSGSTADRYQVVVHVGAEETRAGPISHIEDGPGVTAVTSRRIACDSSIVRITEDENGEPLSMDTTLSIGRTVGKPV